MKFAIRYAKERNWRTQTHTHTQVQVKRAINKAKKNEECGKKWVSEGCGRKLLTITLSRCCAAEAPMLPMPLKITRTHSDNDNNNAHNSVIFLYNVVFRCALDNSYEHALECRLCWWHATLPNIGISCASVWQAFFCSIIKWFFFNFPFTSFICPFFHSLT